MTPTDKPILFSGPMVRAHHVAWMLDQVAKLDEVPG